MNIEIIRKAESIVERVDLIVNKRVRLGAVDHSVLFNDFLLSYEPQTCHDCDSELTPEDAYWNNGKCNECERLDFINNEIQKLEQHEASKVLMLIQFSSSYKKGITYKH